MKYPAKIKCSIWRTSPLPPVHASKRRMVRRDCHGQQPMLLLPGSLETCEAWATTQHHGATAPWWAGRLHGGEGKTRWSRPGDSWHGSSNQCSRIGLFKNRSTTTKRTTVISINYILTHVWALYLYLPTCTYTLWLRIAEKYIYKWIYIFLWLCPLLSGLLVQTRFIWKTRAKEVLTKGVIS